MVRQLCALGLFALALPCFSADFSGTFEGSDGADTAVLTLKQDGQKLSGGLKVGQFELKVDGTVAGDVAKGTMKLEPVTTYFTATLSGDKLTLKIAETADMADADSIDFTRKGGVTSQTPTTFNKEASDVLKSGKEYVHASGGKFRYPSNWNIKEGEGFVQLIPSDASDSEIYMVKAESAEGAQDPGSTEILSYLDSQLSEAVPDARREGLVEKTVAGAGKGVVVNWTGTVNGKKSSIRAYVTIVKNYGVALIAIAPKDQLERREKQLRQVFQTIGWGQGKIDPQIVGAWNYWGYKGSADGKYGREERAQCVLNADGTFTYSNSAETSISASGTDQGGNETWVGGMNSRKGSGWSGTWTADGSTLILNFADGSAETVTYHFEQQGQNTFLVTQSVDKKAKMEWSRA